MGLPVVLVANSVPPARRLRSYPPSALVVGRSYEGMKVAQASVAYLLRYPSWRPFVDQRAVSSCAQTHSSRFGRPAAADSGFVGLAAAAVLAVEGRAAAVAAGVLGLIHTAKSVTPRHPAPSNWTTITNIDSTIFEHPLGVVLDNEKGAELEQSPR